jgi:ATP-binding cassette subfamily F protein 3
MRGDKVALIGANGLGKSTLLKMLTGKEPFEGEMRWGHNAVPAFFAQHQSESLDPRNTILEQMALHSRQKGETYVRSVLGGFLFTGDDVEKKISVLSGGEKSRIALAHTLLTDSNCLLLDEPTNHLDITSIAVLIRALKDYKGSFVVVSHDRWFLSEVANKIWYIEDKQLKEYPGVYRDFEWAMNARKSVKEPNKEKKAPENGASETVVPQKEEKTRNYEEEKNKKRKARQIEEKIRKTEAEIEKLEKRKNELHVELSDPDTASNFSKLAPLMYEFENTEKELEKAYESWESFNQEKEGIAE